ncbi:hypothetical protein F5Y18DRAFT_378753 [Xylariaceae sp. FL1019]|nr:hypothetical protein F5Y18DRAFT_378753 [Xylariaceae sp. FL1019]
MSGLHPKTEFALLKRMCGPPGILRRRDVTVVLVAHSFRLRSQAARIIHSESMATLNTRATMTNLMQYVLV